MYTKPKCLCMLKITRAKSFLWSCSFNVTSKVNLTTPGATCGIIFPTLSIYMGAEETGARANGDSGAKLATMLFLVSEVFVRFLDKGWAHNLQQHYQMEMLLPLLCSCWTMLSV